MFRSLLSLIIFISILPINNTFDISKENHESDEVQHSIYIDSDEAYCMSRIYKDVGIPFSKTYDGSGIKIGIIDNDPMDFPVEIRAKKEKHALDIQNIICGENGIAPGSQCFIARQSITSEYTLADCLNELIYNKHVDVISCSVGPNYNGCYLQKTNLIDYSVFSSNVPFICAAGNNNELPYVSSYSLGLNVISVGSIDRNKNLSSFTSTLYSSDYIDKLLSPTLLAPGECLYGFYNSDYEYIDDQLNYRNRNDGEKWPTLNGTSYATPIVAGIVALLMEEFSYLKNDFGKLYSIITNSCTYANEQLYMPDYGGFGFGIVNYTNARHAAANSNNGQIFDNANDDCLLFQSDITIPNGQTINANAFVKFGNQLHLGNENAQASYNDLVFSNIAINLIDINSNSIIDWAYPTSNYTQLSFYNETILTNFRLEIRLIEKSNYGITEYFSLSYFLDHNYGNYIEIVDGGTIDSVPRYAYSIRTENTILDRYYGLLFFDYKKNLVFFTSPSSTYYGETLLSLAQWNSLISIPGREYYICLVVYNFAFIPIRYSEIFDFYEPTSFSNSLQILPKDWGFPQMYNYEEIETTHYMASDTFIITCSRLRCGYIENMYINLSPRRINAGIAYIELLFSQPVYDWMVGITLWKRGELYHGRQGDVALIQTYYQNCWNTEIDLLNDNGPFLPDTRKQVDRYIGEGPIYGLRIYTESDPFGNTNKGRLCVDDIVLNINSNNNTIGCQYYEAIVENKTFAPSHI